MVWGDRGGGLFRLKQDKIAVNIQTNEGRDQPLRTFRRLIDHGPPQ
jgi:hypothetical protein